MSSPCIIPRFHFLCRGSDQASQSVSLGHINYFELKVIDPTGSWETSVLFSLNYLEEYELRALPVIILSLCWLVLWQSKLLITEHLLLSSCNDPLKLQGAFPRPYLRMSSIPHFPFLFLNLSCVQGVCRHVGGIPIHMYVIKFGYFLLLICLM